MRGMAIEGTYRGVETRRSMLDICFTIDCTGSMSPYIEESKNSIRRIINRITQEEGADVRFAVVAYRDHPPQDHTFITKVYSFTSDIKTMENSLSQLSAGGGGDAPEAVGSALSATDSLLWRPNAAKIVFLIGDAPPHGVDLFGDTFPQGEPNGNDPIKIAGSMAAKGITIYPIACGDLFNSNNARSILATIAQMTNGVVVSLASSMMLPEVVLGGSTELLGLTNIAERYKSEIKKIRNDQSMKYGKIDEKESAKILYETLKSDKIKTKSWKHDGVTSDVNVINASTLADFHVKLKSQPKTIERPFQSAYVTSSKLALEDISLEKSEKLLKFVHD